MNECRFFPADRICKFFNGRTWEKNKLHKRRNCLTGHRHSRHILQMWQQIFDEEEINAIHFKMCYAVWWHLNLFDLNWDSVSLSIFEFSFAGAICKRQQRQFGSLVPHQVTRVYQSINQSITIHTHKYLYEQMKQKVNVVERGWKFIRDCRLFTAKRKTNRQFCLMILWNSMTSLKLMSLKNVYIHREITHQIQASVSHCCVFVGGFMCWNQIDSNLKEIQMKKKTNDSIEQESMANRQFLFKANKLHKYKRTHRHTILKCIQINYHVISEFIILYIFLCLLLKKNNKLFPWSILPK